MELFDFHAGTTPLVVSMPHSGTYLPPAIETRLAPAARELPDTDWHVPRLYDFAADLGATVLRANYSRYVVDLNRPPDGASLYPGRQTTGLCPAITFAGAPLYADGHALSEAAVSRRRERYWQPYHDRLRAALAERVREHGVALLYDAHSIPSRVPMLFDGVLSDLNLGTAHGASCAPRIQAAAAAVLQGCGYSYVVNGRFVGGYVTRHYGDPANNVHALQMEIAQQAYMSEAGDYAYLDDRAAALAGVLRRVLAALIAAGDGA